MKKRSTGPLALPYLAAATLLLPAAGWANGLAASMYSSRRAMQRGDLIRVIVDEKTSASKEHSLNTSKDFKATAAEGSIGNPASAHALPRAVSGALPPYSLSAGSEFAGTGGTATSESLAASLTAQVTDVLPNGVLVIHGERLVTLGGEEVRMVLTGMVRHHDVTAGNTVHSYQIADARIRYVTTGEVSRGSSPGWLVRLFSRLSPY